jgi:hypothetical protein
MRKCIGLFVLLASVGGQAPLPAADQESPDKTAVKPPPPDYFPIKAGSKWHYQVEMEGEKKGQVTSQIAKIEKIDGQALARLESLVQGNLAASEHLSNTAKGIFRHRYNGLEVAPPICLLKYPVKKGESWEIDAKLGDDKITGTCRVSEAEVEVPAGKYKTIVVQFDAQAGQVKINTTYWFAPGTGMVKQTARVNDGKTITLLLEKYEPGK